MVIFLINEALANAGEYQSYLLITIYGRKNEKVATVLSRTVPMYMKVRNFHGMDQVPIGAFQPTFGRHTSRTVSTKVDNVAIPISFKQTRRFRHEYVCCIINGHNQRAERAPSAVIWDGQQFGKAKSEGQEYFYSSNRH